MTVSIERRRQLRDFARPIKLRFLSYRLLNQSLTHSSYAYEQRMNGEACEDNERLEFLGDAVLSLVVSRYLVREHPELSVGDCSKIKAEVVSSKALQMLAEEMEVEKYMLLGKSASHSTSKRHMGSILADALEGIIGAVYLATGLWNIGRFILRHFTPMIEEAVQSAGEKDFKSLLQERVQRSYKTIPAYRLQRQSGPEHDKVFETRVFIGQKEYAQGAGHSKKEAEQEAAQRTLEMLSSQA